MEVEPLEVQAVEVPPRLAQRLAQVDKLEPFEVEAVLLRVLMLPQTNLVLDLDGARTVVAEESVSAVLKHHT